MRGGVESYCNLKCNVRLISMGVLLFSEKNWRVNELGGAKVKLGRVTWIKEERRNCGRDVKNDNNYYYF